MPISNNDPFDIIKSIISEGSEKDIGYGFSALGAMKILLSNNEIPTTEILDIQRSDDDSIIVDGSLCINQKIKVSVLQTKEGKEMLLKIITEARRGRMRSLRY